MPVKFCHPCHISSLIIPSAAVAMNHRNGSSRCMSMSTQQQMSARISGEHSSTNSSSLRLRGGSGNFFSLERLMKSSHDGGHCFACSQKRSRRPQVVMVASELSAALKQRYQLTLPVSHESATLKHVSAKWRSALASVREMCRSAGSEQSKCSDQ